LLRRLLCLPRDQVNNLSLVRYITLPRIVVAMGFLIAAIVATAVPVYFAEPDDWTYYFAVQNFAQGQLTVDDQTHSGQANEVRRKGGIGMGIQYVNSGYNKWALEKAPGYVFYLVPFKLLGIPRGGNILLALGMVVMTFILLKRLRDEKTAAIGSLLMLFTPMSLIMLNRTYMDTYASMSFLVIGGGLYIYYRLERDRIESKKGHILLFLAFFFCSWSVVTRYTNLPVVAVLALHYTVLSVMSSRSGESRYIKSESLPLVMGLGLPAVAILLYDYVVFGSPLDYGYHYTLGDIKFAFQYLGQVNQNGQSIPLQIIWNNLKAAPRPLLVGFPLLVIGIPGIVVILYHKYRSQWLLSEERVKSWNIGVEIPWNILLILIGWFGSVFFLYLTYEWTANFAVGPFFHFARFYLPGLFPVAVICALIMSRFSFKLYIPALVGLSAFGTIIFLQSSANLNILPGWFLNGPPRRLPPGFGPGRFPGGYPPDGNPPFPPGSLPGNG
jgi:hypothetical protein